MTLCGAAQATSQKGAHGPWVQVGPWTAPSQAPEECERQLYMEGRGTPEGAGSQARSLPEEGSDSHGFSSGLMKEVALDSGLDSGRLGRAEVEKGLSRQRRPEEPAVLPG